MLFWFLGMDPLISTLLDVLLIVLVIVLVGYLLRNRRLYGFWKSLANCDQIVVAIGRDRQARLLCGERKYGIYLSLGDYGEVPLDPEAVYKIINVPQKNSIAMVYLPYALLLRAKEMAAVSKLSRNPGAGKEIRVRAVVGEDGEIYCSCPPGASDEECTNYLRECREKILADAREKGVKDLRIEIRDVVSDIEVQLDSPEIIRAHDIRNWQEYAFHPILIKSMNESYVVEEIGAAKGILGSIWIRLLPIIAIVAVIALILSIIR